METVKLTVLTHREKECIGIYAPQTRLPTGEPLNYFFQKKAGAKWSKTNKCWYVPCTEQNYELLARVLKGKVILDVQELKQYLMERKHGGRSALINKPAPVVKTVIKNSQIRAKPVQKLNPVMKLSIENNDALEKFIQQLVLKRYAESTIRTYTQEFMQLLQTLVGVPASELSVQRFHPVGLKKIKCFTTSMCY